MTLFYRPQAENRIVAMTSSRSDWCISRQRTWGVPIPVFYHVDSQEPLITEETIEHIKGISVSMSCISLFLKHDHIQAVAHLNVLFAGVPGGFQVLGNYPIRVLVSKIVTEFCVIFQYFPMHFAVSLESSGL